MKNFRRAVRDAWHYWPFILLATICSFGVATLWAANIGALLPVIEMTLKGESTQDWLESSIERQREEIAKNEEKIAAIDALPAPQRDEVLAERKNLVNNIEYTQSKIAWNQWSLGWAQACLPATPFETICFIMGILLVSTVIKHVMMLASDLLIGHVSTSIVRGLRTRIFDRSLVMDRRTYQSYGTSTLLANITHTADGLSQGLLNFFGAAIREPLRIASCLVLASMICPRLLLLSLVLAPAMIYIVSWSNRRIKSIASSILGRNIAFHEVILEALSNIFTVQAYTMEDSERERFAVSTKQMRDSGMKMIFYTGLSRPFMELIGVGMIAITVCAGAYLVINKQTHIGFLQICNEPLTISELMIFFGALIGASDPLRKLSGVSTAIFTGALAADAIYQMLDHPSCIAESSNPITCPKPHREIALQDVDFHYDPSCPVLQKVNLTIPFGSTVAVIGSNGSGKSTMVQLLERFYDPTHGRVTIDGLDYRDLRIADIRQRIALVSQTTELFNRSVMENILYGSENATQEEAIEAAKTAHAHEFITTALSNGYDTIVGQSGQKLSGGQRQRIAIARAILRKPELLILDESTSQIDMASELQIRETLETMKGKLTIVIITHREALLAIADRVYEVAGGSIVEKQHVHRIAA